MNEPENKVYDFEKLKRRIMFIVWAFFILSFAYFFVTATREIPQAVFFILIGSMLLFNIALTIEDVRRKINRKTFFAVIILYAIMLAVLIVYSGRVEEITNSIQSPFFLIFFFPIIFASYYYGLAGAFIMATVVVVLDISASISLLYLLGNENLINAFNFFMLVRVSLYYLIAFFVSFTEEDKMKEAVEVKDEKEKQFKALIEDLKQKNQELVNKINEIKQDKKYSTREIKRNALLLDLSRTLSKELDLMTVLSTTLEKIREMIVYNSAAAFLYNSDKTELIITAHKGLYEEEMKLSLRADIGIPYIVAQTEKVLYIPDTDEDPRFKEITETAKVKSALYVPIEMDDEVFGVICLWRMEKESYGEQDIKLLQTITNQAARSIKNAEIYRKLDTRLNFIVTLWETSKTLTSSLDLSSAWEKVLEQVLKTTSYLFNADKLIFFQYRKETRELVPYIALNVSQGTKDNFIIKLKQDPVMLSDFLRSDFQVKNIVKDPRFSVIAPFAVKENISSMLWSPLIGRNRIIGALALFSTSRRIWTKEETQWLDIFTSMLSMTLENVMLLYDLVSEKNQLQGLIDNVPEGVFTTDANRKILTWNRAAEKITSFKSMEVIGKDCCKFIKCQSMEEEYCTARCFVDEAMNKHKKVDSELENMFIMNKEGNRVPVFITAAPIFNEEGQVAGSILVFRDITKEKEIERMKEEFLATITHDLKSPLASIMGYAELMLNPKLGGVNEGQKEFLDAILRSSKTLQILINNILESTRMEAGKITFNPVIYKLGELVSEIEEMFRPLFAHKNLNFNTNVNSSIIVFSDREKIKEVFINLISNAIKFTPEGGTIAISAYKTDGLVEVRVSDTGKGIPQSEIPKLFKKFSQVKGEKRGTGLGLYICKKIIEAHDQTIGVESVLGEGTTFKFTLATRKPAKERKTELSVMLIVKDEPLIKMMERVFLEEQFKVFSASNIKESREIFNKNILPAVVILDWHLPDGEALEIMDEIRDNEKTENVPILLLCDYREDISGDFDAVVNKPVNFKDLLMKTNAFARSNA